MEDYGRGSGPRCQTETITASPPQKSGPTADSDFDFIRQDVALARLITFPNALTPSHLGFLMHEALLKIADTIAGNVRAFEREATSRHGHRIGLIAASPTIAELAVPTFDPAVGSAIGSQAAAML